MVSTGQMTALATTIMLPLLAGMILYYFVWKKSSKIETGMFGAIGYGIAGYFWEEIIYSFLALVALTKMTNLLNTTGGSAIFVAFVEALLSGIFVAAGMYWGVYLTNTKQRSLYRSATVGIGFGFGYVFLTYGFQLYYAIKVNLGTFAGAENTKKQLLATTQASLYVGAYRNILMVIIFMGIALYIGKFYLEKNYKIACAFPLVVYVFIRFTDVILNTYLSVMVAKIIVCVILTIISAGVMWIIQRWLKKGII